MSDQAECNTQTDVPGVLLLMIIMVMYSAMTWSAYNDQRMPLL